MITVLFESHAASLDNEAKLASGRYDVALSSKGEQQARELGERYQNRDLQAVYCSDLQRTYRTAEIAFTDRRIRIVRDRRLRECDYGDLTRQPRGTVMAAREQHVRRPFPGGESYRQAAQRIREVLEEIVENHDGATILIIGHRATQYALEHWIQGTPLDEAVTAPWKWQPGWMYHLDAARFDRENRNKSEFV